MHILWFPDPRTSLKKSKLNFIATIFGNLIHIYVPTHMLHTYVPAYIAHSYLVLQRLVVDTSFRDISIMYYPCLRKHFRPNSESHRDIKKTKF